MSKYKVGDKVLLECQIEQYGDEPILAIGGYRMKLDDGCEACITHKTYEQGLADAWELADRLNNMAVQDVIDIYGFILDRSDVFDVISPQEALAKIEAYEQEIKVGDVVRVKDNPSTEIWITATSRGLNGVYLQTDELGRIGEVNSGISKYNVEKTGKHIDIQQILDGIGKE